MFDRILKIDFARISSLLTALVFAPACVSSQSLQVIERSKKEVPEWTQESPNTISNGSTTFRYLFVRANVSDLILGIKHAQLQAVHSFRNELVRRTVTPILELMQDSQSYPKEVQSAFGLLVNQLSQSEALDRVKIVDIYFESSQVPASSAETLLHTIYVLSEFPFEQRDILTQQFLTLLDESDIPQIRSAASIYRKSVL